MQRLWAVVNPATWREEYLRTAARFEAHIEECTRMRAEDLRIQAERHLENQRRLDVQDRMQERLVVEVDGVRSDISKQFMKMVWTVAGGMAAVSLSLLGFILTKFLH